MWVAKLQEWWMDRLFERVTMTKGVSGSSNILRHKNHNFWSWKEYTSAYSSSETWSLIRYLRNQTSENELRFFTYMHKNPKTYKFKVSLMCKLKNWQLKNVVINAKIKPTCTQLESPLNHHWFNLISNMSA